MNSSGVYASPARNFLDTSRGSPLRKGLARKSLVVETLDDDEERRQHQKNVELLHRLSELPETPRIDKPEAEIRNHIDACIKLFTENKITNKNAWNLNIIDYLRSLARSDNFALQAASSSLDVSTKVYGIRVDDIHSDGIKLAGNLSHAVHKQDKKNNEENISDGERDESPQSKSKKKKKKTISKRSILSEYNNILADVPKAQSSYFKTQSNSENSIVDNYFSNTLPMNYTRCKFSILGTANYWCEQSYEDESLIERKFEMTPRFRDTPLCPDFKEFDLVEWDFEAESLEEKNRRLLDDILVFDKQGIPQAELDSSVHNIFEEQGVEDYSSSDEENHEMQFGDNRAVENVSELRPDASAPGNDYTFKTNMNMFLSQVWAGPSHWKLKHIRRAESKFSGIQENKVQQKKKRKIVELNTLDNFAIEIESLELDRKCGKTNRLNLEAENKYILPMNYLRDTSYRNKLFSAPKYLVTLNGKEPNGDKNVEDIAPYDYNNPNDSQYCPENMVDDDDDPNNEGDVHEEIVNQVGNFLGENLVDQPVLVPKVNLHYATRAKKMDMKKLKCTIFKELTEENNDPDVSVLPSKTTSFKEVFKNLPSKLNKSMREELSCPLAFIAVLHLANEHNLKLTNRNLSDFVIEQGTTENHLLS